MRDFQNENLSHDAVHGYIPFVARGVGDEVAERQIIDHPWVQRLRQIHQLQTAWWVYPTAEHTRFQHVVGVMHLASRAAAALYDSLREVAPDVPSRGYVETLLRMAGLLHDVGHGPFGHFFDEHFLAAFGLTHETLGARIICDELGPLLRGVRSNPHSRLESGEELDPRHVAILIARPKSAAPKSQSPQSQSPQSTRSPSGQPAVSAAGEPAPPRWLLLLRSLFSGLYTVDNMDFVLRDAYMTGYSAKAFDLERLLHYSFFSDEGLTIHDRGLSTLVSFLAVKAELFRTVYFHRTVRAIDLALADLFAESRAWLFPGNPLEHLSEYQRFTEWSLLVDVARWPESERPEQRETGLRWRQLLQRDIPWKTVCQRRLVFRAADAEKSSIFNHPDFVERQLRAALPPQLADMPLRVDMPRHIHRPDTRGAAAGQNFWFDPVRGQVRALSDDQLFGQLPFSHRMCRVYAHDFAHAAELSAALEALAGPEGADDPTNV